MLNQVLNNAQTDASLHQLVQEMHSIFTNPAPQLPPGGLVVMPRYASTASDMASSSNPERGMATSPGFVSFAAPSPMYDAMSRMNISGRPVHHANTAIAAMSVHDLSTLSSRRSPYPPGDNITENAPPIPLNLPSDRNGASSHPSAVLKPAQRDTGPYLLSRSQGHDLFNPQRTLPPSLIAINEQRQAISVREYNTYMQERTQNAERPVPALQPIPVKPAFLRSVAPDLQQLRKGLEYIFRPLSNGGKTDQACAELQERSKEVKEWIVGFSKYIQEITTPNSEQVDLLVALNAEMERTNSKMQRLFYEACNDAQLVNELGKFQRCTKSVRLMKEIEEFEDAMEDWMDEGR